MREALEKIRDEYGPNHGSKYCRDIAASALSSAEPLAEIADLRAQLATALARAEMFAQKVRDFECR